MTVFSNRCSSKFVERQNRPKLAWPCIQFLDSILVYTSLVMTDIVMDLLQSLHRMSSTASID